ncbi:hypothetical protein D3C72_1446040 [compost metagenome]
MQWAQQLGRPGQQRRDARPVPADRAVAMHDHANGDAARAIKRAAPCIGIGNRDHVAEAQAAQPVAFARGPVGQLDIVVTAPGRVLAEPRAHDAGRHEVRHRHVQACVALHQSPAAQQARGAVEHFNARVSGQAQAQAVGHDLDPVADLQPHQNFGRKVHQHMIDPAVLAGDKPRFANARPADDSCEIADAGIGDQRSVGAIARADHLAIVVVQGDARLDMVARQAHAEVADAPVQDNATGARQHARHAVVPDPVR